MRRRRFLTRTVRGLFAIYDELEAAGVPKEDARFVLPYCFCSNFFCSMNARELLHVMNELRYGRGSEIPELWALGESLFLQCEEKLPFLAVRKEAAYAHRVLPLPDGMPVLPEAQVTLLDGTREPEKLICRAAYLANGMQAPGLTRDEQARILRTLLQNNRKRELEQASFTLLYSGMSLAALTHLTRHRMQALCAPDLLENADYSRFVLPESVRKAGMESRYREAFSIAEAAARKLSSLGAGKDALSYLLVSGLEVPGCLDDERRRALYVFSPSHVRAGAVGDPGAGHRGVKSPACGASGALFPLRPDLLHDGRVSRGQNVLRKDGAGAREIFRNPVK